MKKICDLVVSDDLEDAEADNLGGALSILLSMGEDEDRGDVLPIPLNNT